MPDFDAARERMVRQHIAARGIVDAQVLQALRQVPRECFVEADMQALAYEDCALPIGEGQTISQPYIVALMLAAAGLSPRARVLEVGTGSGYAAALMSRIVAQVHTVERLARLAADTRERLGRLGYTNIDVHVGDGSLGWPEAAPFDAILVAAGAPDAPAALRRQLAPGGCLLVPVGDGRQTQQLRKIRRVAVDRFEEQDLCAVRFVPLLGQQGWPVADAG